MRPPRYAQDDAELTAWSHEAKRWACPHCRRHGTLNVHGSLRGCAEKGPGKEALRGRRFLCSNRGLRPGCGRTFSILLATVLAQASVRSRYLWRFYRAKFALGSVLSAWESLKSIFSVEAAYGWWRRWQRGQFLLRALLCRKRDPPPGGTRMMHAAAVLGDEDPIASFQASEQTAWPS